MLAVSGIGGSHHPTIGKPILGGKILSTGRVYRNLEQSLLTLGHRKKNEWMVRLSNKIARPIKDVLRPTMERSAKELLELWEKLDRSNGHLNVNLVFFT